MSAIMNNPDKYESEVARYKKKYTKFRCEVSMYLIKSGLNYFGYTLNDLPKLLSESNNELKQVVEHIGRSIPDGVGNTSSVLYTSVIGELLDLCEIEYEVHVGFVLPVKVADVSKYNYSLVNYMYIISSNGVSYHYFNGKINGDDFTFIKDDIVEV